MPKAADLPPIFCKQCGYCLFGLPENRCPECGRSFDPADPKTFLPRPRRLWLGRVLVWGGVSLLALLLAYGGFLTWLYVGWRSEAGARGLLTHRYDKVQMRPILPPALCCLLQGECRQWQERVDSLRIFDGPLSAQQLASIAACTRLKSLFLCDVPLTAEGVAVLCQCKQLEELHLIGNNTSASSSLGSGDVAPLLALRGLRKLSLWRNYRIDDAAMAVVGQMTQLESLNLDETAVSDAGLAQLVGLQNLQELDLYICRDVTEGAVPYLSRLKALTKLRLAGTRLTLAPDAIAALRRALPRCPIAVP